MLISSTDGGSSGSETAFRAGIDLSVARAFCKSVLSAVNSGAFEGPAGVDNERDLKRI